ncbi:MAG: DNA repair protein RadC [Firmicutes bacterium]|nr:DNA repair protein RadC [Bacillota bacterium]
MPVVERPRERMQRLGPSSLSTAELIALVMGTGRPGMSAVSLAEGVLSFAGGLRELLDVDTLELMQVPGVGSSKAVAILAAIELGRRLVASGADLPTKITSPEDAAAYLMERLRFLRKEHFVTLHLDTKHQVVGEEIVSIGSLNASIAHPREIFRTALKRNAAAIVCAHNHPSGDPAPSAEDIQVTERLVAAGRILGIDVLDHIVFGDRRYVSLRERGHIGS